uniref:Uncharacterized protein n=1 Tax=Picea sitchensis TaxID=3332 RepID=A0A6B9XXZ9_PICSI|nr:hypothetical protein Q903MT_gene6963 [Picea sitchensis]
MYVIQLPTISVSQRKAQSGPPMESFYLSYQPSSLPLFLTHHPTSSYLGSCFLGQPIRKYFFCSSLFFRS